MDADDKILTQVQEKFESNINTRIIIYTIESRHYNLKQWLFEAIII